MIKIITSNEPTKEKLYKNYLKKYFRLKIIKIKNLFYIYTRVK